MCDNTTRSIRLETLQLFLMHFFQCHLNLPCAGNISAIFYWLPRVMSPLRRSGFIKWVNAYAFIQPCWRWIHLYMFLFNPLTLNTFTYVFVQPCWCWIHLHMLLFNPVDVEYIFICFYSTLLALNTLTYVCIQPSWRWIH